MDDFASTALFNLIAVELQRQGFEVQTNPQFEGKTERSSKANLLDAALEQLGPVAILRIGAGIRRVTFDPTLAVLLKAVDAHDLIERWQRLEGYFHGNHRVRLLEHTDTSATLEHYALKGSGPSEGEDLVIAGLLAALLQQIGRKQLNLSIDNEAMIVGDTVVDTIPRSLSTRTWHYSWSRAVSANSETKPLDSNRSAADRVSTLLASDLGRCWKINAVAELLNTSPRSLQRSLAKSGASFQTLLRSARADGAAAMLLQDQHRLAEIGYATGFSDQAHFSREFKLRFNMPPTEYVALSQ